MLVLHRYEKGSSHGSEPPSCLSTETAMAFLQGFFLATPDSCASSPQT